MRSATRLLRAAMLALACAVVLVTASPEPSPGTVAQAAGRHAGGKPVSAAVVEAALRRRLDHEYLSYHWVVCVKMDRFYKGRRLWRCNVDFGDPHIVQYCAILVGHTLVTDRENHALNCDRRP